MPPRPAFPLPALQGQLAAEDVCRFEVKSVEQGDAEHGRTHACIGADAGRCGGRRLRKCGRDGRDEDGSAGKTEKTRAHGPAC